MLKAVIVLPGFPYCFMWNIHRLGFGTRWFTYCFTGNIFLPSPMADINYNGKLKTAKYVSCETSDVLKAVVVLPGFPYCFMWNIGLGENDFYCNPVDLIKPFWTVLILWMNHGFLWLDFLFHVKQFMRISYPQIINNVDNFETYSHCGNLCG